MKIRTATMKDLTEIVSIEATCFPMAEAATEESFQKRLEAFSERGRKAREKGCCSDLQRKIDPLLCEVWVCE